MIRSDDLVKTIITFRSACFERFPNDIDTLKPEMRSNRLGHFTSGEMSKYLAELINDPIDHIARVVRTPRLLKTILRRVVQSWETLHGEIDFDDLLVANVLRFGAPEAYDFLLENHREIRGLQSEGVLKEKEKRKERLRIKWDGISKSASWDVTAGEELLAFLFPSWATQPYIHQEEIPQGVMNSTPTDYWLRLNIQEVNEDEVRDQDTLHAMIDWKKDPTTVHYRGLSLVEALFAHEELVPKLEHLAPLVMDGRDFRQLASLLFEIMLNKQGVKANSNSCAAFIPLWRLAIRNPIDPNEHIEWILKEIKVALPRSLRFANDLYYYWKSNDRSDVELKEPHPELREPIVQEAKSVFQYSPERFIKSLDPDFMYSVYHFVILFSQPDKGGSGFNPIDWKWFIYFLVEAARLAPQIIIPQIVPLVVKEEMTFHDSIYTFDKEMALQLFGDKFFDIMTLMAQPLDLSRFNERERKWIECARQEAQKFVKISGVGGN